MAYRRSYRNSGLHGQIRHRPSAAGRFAAKRSRAVYRKMIHKPKRIVAKAYANTVGQIAYREAKKGIYHPIHGRSRRMGGRMHRRSRRY